MSPLRIFEVGLGLGCALPGVNMCFNIGYKKSGYPEMVTL
jgi:hypothetical protein